MDISFIIPSRNNAKYLKLALTSILRNKGIHNVEVLVADDNSSDDTFQVCELFKSELNISLYKNISDQRLGITVLNDYLISKSSYDICIMFHADMYLFAGALDEIEKYLLQDDRNIVTLTRIEPSLHPPGPEKVVLENTNSYDVESFDLDYLESLAYKLKMGRVTEGIFAPFAFFKKNFLLVGGHDQLFYPTSKEDSDLFNRFKLNGFKFIQTWAGFVFHFTSRGSRFNPSITTPGVNSDEWLKQNKKSERNFVRKWGWYVTHDQYLNPIILPKLNRLLCCDSNDISITDLELLEPFFDSILIPITEKNLKSVDNYILKEQPNTLINLENKFFDLNSGDRYKIFIKSDLTFVIKKENILETIKNIPKFVNYLMEKGDIGVELELNDTDSIVVNSLHSNLENLKINSNSYLENKNVNNIIKIF